MKYCLCLNSLKSNLKKLIKLIIIFFIPKFLKIINHFFNIKFSTIAEEKIGHLVYACDIHVRRSTLKKNTFKLIIIIDNPCNYTILNIFKNKLCFFHAPLFKKFINISKIKLMENGCFFSLNEYQRSYIEYYDFKSPWSLSDDQINLGYKIVSDWGIKEDNWWVCFHGRDPTYLKKLFPDRNFDYHNYRDFDANTMILGMKEVIKNNGFVIIMGDKDADKINIKHPRVIHYNKLYKNDFLEVFLSARALFFVGNSSGLKSIANAFNVPIACINQIGFNLMIQQKNSLMIYKKLFCNKINKMLTFDEMKEIGLFSIDEDIGYTTEYYEKNLLTPIENSSKEILYLVKEMIEKLKNPNFIEPSNDQIKFKKTYFGNFSDIEKASNISQNFLNINKKLFFNY